MSLIGGGSVKTYTLIMFPYIYAKDRHISSIYGIIFLVTCMIVIMVFRSVISWIYKEKKWKFLTLKNISFSYKDKVIFDNYNFVMNKEEIIAMIGPSGCGKSTLLKIINGLETDYSGDVLLDGVNVNNIPVNKRDIVLMFQDNLLFPHMTIFENIEFSLKMKKYPKHEIKKW